jgi:glutamyl-tRNA reductase
VLRAEAIVAEEVGKFSAWLRSRGAVPTVVALRQKFESIRRSEVERLDFKLSALSPEARPMARACVDEITRLMVEKLLLMPTEQLKDLGEQETLAVYSEALTRLFGLSGSVGSEHTPEVPEQDRGTGSGRVEAFRPKAKRTSGSGS